MEKIINRILQRLNGKLRFQAFFKKMQVASLEGQNYYNAVDVNRTGEINVISAIASKITPENKFVFFDVGAHQGQYTELLLSKIDIENIEAHLFEPQKKAFDILIEKYSSKENFFLNHKAVSNITADAQLLYVCSKQNLVATIVDFPIQEFASHLLLDQTETVDIVKLDNYCLLHNISSIDLIKLDVEGFEYQCLLPLKEMLQSGKIKHIQFEYCFINMVNRNYFYDFWALLKDSYEIYRVIKDGLYKIDQYNIIYEQMAPINYLAVLK